MNITQLMKQAQQLQKKVEKKQKELDQEVHTFADPSGLIQGTMKGNLEIQDLVIDSKLCNAESKEDLEALITVTINRCIKEITEKKDKEMSAITGNAKGLF